MNSVVYMSFNGHPPIRSLRGLSRGMWRFWRSRSLAAVVADDLVDLYDDVLGDAGLYGIAIDHLCEVKTRPNSRTKIIQITK